MPDLSFAIKAIDEVGSTLSNVKGHIKGAADEADGAKSKFSSASDGLKNLALAAGGVGAAFGATKLFGDSIGAAESLAKGVSSLRKEIGGTPEDASRLKFAFQEMGVGGDEANRSIARFSKGLSGLIENEDGTTSKSSALIDRMKAMGVTTQDAAGATLPMKDVLGQLADKFKDMPDGAEKTALAMQLFGKQGVDLIGFLNKGSEGLADLYKESDRFGLTLSGPTLDAVKKQTAAHREFDAAMQGVKVQIGVALIPVMSFMAQKGTELAVLFNQSVVPGIKALGVIVNTQVIPPLTTMVQQIWPVFIGHLKDTSSWLNDHVVPALKAFGQFLAEHKEIMVAVGIAIGVVAVAFGVYSVAIGIATIASTAFGVAMAVVTSPITLTVAAIALLALGIIELIKHWDDIVAAVPALGVAFDAVKSVVLAVKDFFTGPFIDGLKTVIQFFTDNWATISDLVGTPFRIAKDIVVGEVKFVVDAVKGALTIIGDVFAIFKDIFTGNWSKLWTDVKALVSDTWDTIKTLVKDKLDEIGGVLGDAWKGILTAAGLAWDGLKSTITTVAGDVLSFFTDHWKDILGGFLLGPFWFFRDQIGDVMKAAANFLLEPLRGAIAGIDKFIGGVASAVNWVGDKLGIKELIPKGWTIPEIPRLASGTSNFGGGMALVGEQGPELVHLPQGAYVYNASQTAALRGLPRYEDGGPVGPPQPPPSGLSPEDEALRQRVLAGESGLAGGKITGAVSDFVKEWAEKGIGALVDHALDLFGVHGLDLPGVFSKLGTAIFGKLKTGMVDSLGGLLDEAKKKLLPTAAPGSGAVAQDIVAWATANAGAWGVDAKTFALALLTLSSYETNLSDVESADGGGGPFQFTGGTRDAAVARGFNIHTAGGSLNAFAASGDMAAGVAALRGWLAAHPGDTMGAAHAMELAMERPSASVDAARVARGDFAASFRTASGILGMAKGGTIREPIIGWGLRSGTRYKFGEEGDEVVIPLDGPGEFRGTQGRGFGEYQGIGEPFGSGIHGTAGGSGDAAYRLWFTSGASAGKEPPDAWIQANLAWVRANIHPSLRLNPKFTGGASGAPTGPIVNGYITRDQYGNVGTPVGAQYAPGGGYTNWSGVPNTPLDAHGAAHPLAAGSGSPSVNAGNTDRWLGGIWDSAARLVMMASGPGLATRPAAGVPSGNTYNITIQTLDSDGWKKIVPEFVREIELELVRGGGAGLVGTGAAA